MRELGYRTVDLLVDWLADESQPPLRRATPEEMSARLAGVVPAGFDDALDRLFRDVLPYTSRSAHPRFFAYIPFAGTWPGALGDFVASAANVYAGSWQEAAGPSQLELELLGWFKEWIGYPATAGGSLLTGGSAANLTAIACAREAVVGAMRDDLVAYVSDQAHFSLARAARVLGFRPDQVRVLPVGDDLRLESRTLEAALAADRRAGRRPFLVCANGGATSTGAVDPVGELAELCRAHGLWLHLDAAYGGFAVLTERGRAALGDLAAADSVTLDPHKWLYQPYECGCLLVRDGDALRSAFRTTSDYLRDAETDGGEVNFADLGLQLSRTSRAFKLWLSLGAFGVDAFREAIDRTLDLAEHAARRIEASPRLSLAAPPSLGIVCFERDDGEVDGLVAALEESGVGLISSTRVHGREVLRLCILNHTSTAGDVDAVLEFLEQAAPVAAPAAYDRAVPIAELGRLLHVPAGETVVERWQTGRELFILEHGRADVLVDGDVVASLSPGDHFGEIAALEWGSGFAHSRAADVVATEALVLRVLDQEALRTVLARYPQFEATLRRSAHERLRHAR